MHTSRWEKKIVVQDGAIAAVYEEFIHVVNEEAAQTRGVVVWRVPAFWAGGNCAAVSCARLRLSESHDACINDQREQARRKISIWLQSYSNSARLRLMRSLKLTGKICLLMRKRLRTLMYRAFRGNDAERLVCWHKRIPAYKMRRGKFP